MTEEKVNSIIANVSKLIPEQKLIIVKEKLSSIDDSRYSSISCAVKYKNPTTATLLAVFLGSLGVDRFYTGSAGLGVAKLLTAGGCMIWWLIDCCTAAKRAKEYNFNNLMMIL